jgi:hypothetical protein
MTHYNTSYKELSRSEADEKAIQDIIDWLGQEKFDKIVEHLKDQPINTVNFALSFAGVSGYPFHSFCRKYMLDRYRAWMAEEPDPIATDENGYPIEQEN